MDFGVLIVGWERMSVVGSWYVETGEAGEYRVWSMKGMGMEYLFLEFMQDAR